MQAFVTAVPCLTRFSRASSALSSRPAGGRATSTTTRMAYDPNEAYSASQSATSKPASSTPAVEEEDDGYQMPELSIDGEALKESALAAVGDVQRRPGYYGKVAAYAVGAVVGYTILKAVVGAVESLPLVPDVFELIGLAYSAWFVWRYLIFSEAREELLQEVEELLGRTTGEKQDE